MSARGERSGFTLVELMVAIVLSTAVLGAVYNILTNNQRFYRAQSQIVDVQQNVRAVAQILPSELRELSASDGDIIAMSDTALTIKAMRGFGIICAPPSVLAGTVVLRNSLLSGYREIDPARDSALVFRDGDSTRSGDDRWLHAPVASVATGVNCTDGSAATSLTLTGLVGGIGLLDSVSVGSPVRTFEVVNYRLYQDSDRAWWLGVRTFSGGAWSATSPVAGPLRPDDGVSFSYFDADGLATAVPANVAQIQLVVRGRSSQPIQVQGRPRGEYEDSLTVRVALRNN
jgi:prepilin-type N-terminal cleavage/methylation domain-containing protein